MPIPSLQDITNIALRRVGERRVTAAERELNPPIIAFDPAAPNGDHAATVTATTFGSGATLTIEAIRNARRLLERNDVDRYDDMADAIRYGMSPAMAALPREEPRLVEVEIERRLETRQMCVRTTVRTLANNEMIDERDLVPENFTEIVRRSVRQFTNALERDLYEALNEAYARANQGRYGQSAVGGMASHVNDMWRSLTDRVHTTGLPEQKYPWLADFKYKVIEHNGWTATAIDCESALRKEGESMSHCLGASYQGRVHRGEYLAFHISAPKGAKLPDSGFTLGFDRRGEGVYRFDQIKGKKNSTHHCQHSGLLWFVNLVERTIKGEADSFWENYQQHNIGEDHAEETDQKASA